MQDYVDPIQARKNLNKQGTKVLHFIVDSYNSGLLDSPSVQGVLCELLALVCEGRIEGSLDEETMQVRWTLESGYKEFLEKERTIQSQQLGNVVQGPWT